MSGSLLILVLDDEDLIAAMLREVLEDGGYEVMTAASANEAITKLDELGASLAALVTDVNLGSKVTGWDVAKHAREIKPDLPIIYMSGFAENEWTASGVPHSVMLTKPFAPAQLVTVVATLMTQGLAP